MIAEIITIGDELLLGETIDTNAGYIAKKLSSIGLSVRYKSTVGDSIERIEETIKHSLKRAGVIITTGGLGPTDDDLTKRAIVKVFQRRLVLDEKLLEDIRLRYRKRGIEMPAINENQALLPTESTIFKNEIGSAVGIGIIEKDYVFISLPGVPTEMRHVLDSEIIPYLAKKDLGKPSKIITLRLNGIVESSLAELISDGLEIESGVKLAYLPSESGVDLRIVSTDNDKEKAESKARRLVSFLEKKAGKHIYGYDSDTLQSVVGQLLKDNDKTLAVAESCTGGKLGEIVTSAAGSSGYFTGGVVAYSNEVKISQLKVKQSTLDKYGAVSEQTALEMALGARKLFGCDYALSITGVAGPEGGTEEKPVGTTFIGIASAHKNSMKQFNFGRDREMNRARAAYAALEMLRRDILDIE
jgi:nicotinamide-nucleotide amidase